MPAVDLAAAWRAAADVRAGHGVVARQTIEAALDDAITAARSDGGPLLVVGSLYLVGAVRGRLVGVEDGP
jgi:folylpolyglutamate synthase/dihydropteroate synthase